MKTLYIAGAGRSGSTVLANLLGQVDGVFTAGELRYVWSRGLVEDRLCGCGERFSRCPVWTAVLERAFGGPAAARAAAVEAWQARAGRVRQIPLLLAARRHPELLARRLGPSLEGLSRLYSAIEAVTGAAVVVDSSKLPAYGWVLDTAPGIDVSVVHLLRDPRATAYSWGRVKRLDDQGRNTQMQQLSPLRSAFLWGTWNATAEMLWRDRPERYLRVRYEDFAAAPRDTLERVLAFAGRAGQALPFVDDRTAVLAPTHTVAGNPNRLSHGRVTLRLDLQWVDRMRTADRMVVSLLTAPLLPHYGYPLGKPPRESSPAACGAATERTQ